MNADCEYCGTTLDEEGRVVASGSTHYTASCLEYVHAALRATKRELAEVVRAALPITTREPWCIRGEGSECGYCDACRFQEVMRKYKP